MQLSVPYFRQERTFSCGPASLRMLCAFCGRRISEQRLRTEARVSRETGTRRDVLAALGKRHIGAVVSCDALWDDIRAALVYGAPVLVNYREPSEEEGHYALVVGAEGKEVILHDPWNGPYFRLPISSFLKRWIGHNQRRPRGWMMKLP